MKIELMGYEWGSNSDKIKKIGGVEGIKYKIYDNKIIIKIKKKKIALFEKMLSDFITIIDSSKDEENRIRKILKENSKEEVLLEIEIEKDMENWINNLTIYKISPWLPDEWYLEKELKRKKKILWE